MKKLRAISILIFAVILAMIYIPSETLKAQDETSDEADNLEYKELTFFKSYNNCDTSKSEPCSYVSAEWIEYTSGNIKNQLNEFISSVLMDSMYYIQSESKIHNSIEKIADDFLKDYEDNEVVSGRNFPWYYHINSHEHFRNDNVVVLSFISDGYPGGAHGFWVNSYDNLSLARGGELELDDFLKPGFETELNKLIDRQFRKDNNLSQTEDLTTGAWLFENKIEYNNNFAFTKDGLLFFYNQYEIAPYAAGTIEVLIKYEDLSDLISDINILN